VGLNSLEPESTFAAVHKLNTELGQERGFAYPGDIADTKGLSRSLETFSTENGLDIFVANAGITVFKSFLEVEEEEFARLMIRNAKRGRIVLMSSVCGIQAHRHQSDYAMTKAGIVQLARSLSEEPVITTSR